MSRYLADEQLWQFKPVYSLITADEFLGIDPFMPKDIEVTKQGRNNYTIKGSYGIDIFTNHKFTLLVNNELITYDRVESIPEKFDNVISYAPDSTHDITFTYKFKHQGQEFNYTHWVHHDMCVWEEFLPELLKRETNGGWAHASSN